MSILGFASSWLSNFMCKHHYTQYDDNNRYKLFQTFLQVFLSSVYNLLHSFFQCRVGLLYLTVLCHYPNIVFLLFAILLSLQLYLCIHQLAVQLTRGQLALDWFVFSMSVGLSVQPHYRMCNNYVTYIQLHCHHVTLLWSISDSGFEYWYMYECSLA